MTTQQHIPQGTLTDLAITRWQAPDPERPGRWGGWTWRAPDGKLDYRTDVTGCGLWQKLTRFDAPLDLQGWLQVTGTAQFSLPRTFTTVLRQIHFHGMAVLVLPFTHSLTCTMAEIDRWIREEAEEEEPTP